MYCHHHVYIIIIRTAIAKYTHIQISLSSYIKTLLCPIVLHLFVFLLQIRFIMWNKKIIILYISFFIQEKKCSFVERSFWYIWVLAISFLSKLSISKHTNNRRIYCLFCNRLVCSKRYLQITISIKKILICDIFDINDFHCPGLHCNNGRNKTCEDIR